MNLPLNDPRHPWARLIAAARTVRDNRAATSPFGFATRMAALAMGREGRMGSLFDAFALRALGVACALALCSAALNYSELSRRFSASSPGASANEDLLPPESDTVAVVLALAD